MRDYKRYTSAPIYGKTWQLIVKLLRHTCRRTRSAYILSCYKNTANSQNLPKTGYKIWFRKNHFPDIKIAYHAPYQKICIIFRFLAKTRIKNCFRKNSCREFIFAKVGGVQKNSHYLAGNFIFHALYFLRYIF